MAGAGAFESVYPMKNSPGHIAFKTAAIISALTLGGGLVAYRQLSAESPVPETSPPAKPAAATEAQSAAKGPQEASSQQLAGDIDRRKVILSSSKSSTVFTTQDVGATLRPSQTVVLSGSKSTIGIITPTEAEKMLSPGEAAKLAPFSMTRLGPPIFTPRDMQLTPADTAELARFRITPLGKDHRATDSPAAGGLVFYVTEIALEKNDPSHASFRIIVMGDKIQTLPTEAAGRVSDALRKKIMQPDRAWQATYSTYEETAKAAEPRRLQTFYAMPSSKSALIFKFEATADGTIRAVGGNGQEKPDAGFFDAVRAYLQDNPKPAAR